MIPIKVYILTDLEGTAGVHKFEECSPGGENYKRSQRLLTREVNAAVEACFSKDVEEVIVWDGHGPGGINPEILHTEAKLLSGSLENQNCGMDESFDALLIIGQHAMNRVPQANLAHTYSSRSISEMRLNDEPIGELGMRTILAGTLGIPLIFVSGDDKACREAENLVGEVETVAVKEGLGRESCLSLSPKKAQAEINRGVIKALSRLEDFSPFRIEPPFVLETDYFEHDPENPELRGWNREIARTKVEKSDDFLEIAR